MSAPQVDRADEPGGPAPGTAWLDVPAGKLAGWSLVLDAEGIPYRLAPRTGGLSVALRTSDVERALRAIAEYESENPVPEPAPAGPQAIVRFDVGAALALALVALYVFAPPMAGGDGRFERGASMAEAVLAGEVWRTITALTLHADVLHLASNVAAMLVFGSLLAAVAGPGGALALLLLSGAAGNLLNAAFRPPWHSAVGASTAIFGAVGALVGYRLGDPKRGGRPVSWWWPVAAGLVLLALFGTSPRSDVAAHVFGFVAGLGFGVVAGRLRVGASGRATQALLAALAAVAVAASWWLALR